VLHVGDEIDVYVLGINAQEKKIALSIKRTQPEPWSRVATIYEVGQLVRGTVTQLANFGAFARIEDGIEGLIHVSELSEQRIGHPRQVVSERQDLILRIIRIDPARRRMGLSLRRALEASDEEVATALGEDAVELKHELLAREIEPDENEQPEDEPETGGAEQTDVAAAMAVATEEAPKVESDEEPAADAEATQEASADDGADTATEPIQAESEESPQADDNGEEPASE
jgi:small subunit ribosomal protein S1